MEAKVIREVPNLAQTKPEPDKFELLKRTSLRWTWELVHGSRDSFITASTTRGNLGPYSQKRYVAGGLSESNGETEKPQATLK